MSVKNLNSLLNSLTLKEDNHNYSKEDINMLKFLQMVNEKKNVSSIEKPSELHVSTKSAKCQLTNKIDMEKAANILKDIIENDESDTIVGLEYKDISVGCVKKPKNSNKKSNDNDNDNNNVSKKKKFYNQVTILIKPFKEHKNINIKFFLNGSISMTGCLYDDDGIKAINNFITEIKKYPDVFYKKSDISTFAAINYNITLINTDYIVGFKIDRMKLYNLLVKNYKIYVSYDPAIYQGVKISYMWNEKNIYKDGLCKCDEKCRLEKNLRKKNICKIVTIAIFQSGKIIITGASDIKQTNEAYNFINKILYDNYSSIVRFSILDCEITNSDE
jgi:TATA-box binding protein (TBP) (component of TFIID and TFIIIB)